MSPEGIRGELCHQKEDTNSGGSKYRTIGLTTALQNGFTIEPTTPFAPAKVQQILSWALTYCLFATLW